ncbi:uncharacterized protein LOC105189527 [Harpegnathos saltator]|nr:uncharacterized protein LOC105189527 [Harpegnathos saltator]
MLVNTLCAAFRKLAVDRINTAAATTTTIVRYYSSQHSNLHVSHFMCNDSGVPSSVIAVHDIKFKPGTLNIDLDVPISPLTPKIIEIPVTRIPPLQVPTKNLPVQYDPPLPQTSIDLPSNGNNFEKQAVRLIVIRRKKIKKHKRRKLRKKMKFVWMKLRQRRNYEKVKRFQNEMVAKIKEAQAFDAKEYVKRRLTILNKERIPRTYRGEILPPEMIKRFLAEKKAKREVKRNIPRLTL